MTRLVFSAILPSVGSVSIQLDQPIGPLVAPAHVYVEAINHQGLAAFEETGAVYDGASHEYYHYWTIRGEPLSQFDAPGNMPFVWRDANKFQGKRACIPLTQPGEYTIDLMVEDRFGHKALAFTQPITVQSADDVFPDRDTVYVDQTGAFAGVPELSGKVTSIAALWTYLGSNVRPHRVRLRRGENYQEDSYLRVGSSRSMVHIDAWGEGPKPVLNASNNPSHTWYGRAAYEVYSIAGIDQMSISDVSLRGEWDSTTETGTAGRADGLYIRPDGSQELFLTMHGVDVSGFGKGISLVPSGGANPTHMCFVNSVVTNWRDYGVYEQGMETSELAVVGSAIYQDPDALHGGTDRDGEGSSDTFLNNHGPIRMDAIGFLYMHGADLFSRTGWSVANAGHRADQPCLRFNTNGQPNKKLHISRCVMEGGYQIINMEGENGNAGDYPGTHIIEDTLLIGNAKQTSTMVSCHHGGTTIRNILVKYPDVLMTGAASSRGVFSFQSNNPQNGNLDEPVSVYGCTVLNHLVSESDFGSNMGFVSASNFNTYIEENNVHHFPDGTNAVVADAPVVTETLAGITPRFKGTRYGWLPIKVALPSGGLLHGGTLTIPYADIDKQLTNKTLESAGATDQAYWLANGGPKHRIGSKNAYPHLTADTGGISVVFDTTAVVITNTSGKTFGAAGGNIYVQLDRSSIIPPMDTSFASPATISVARAMDGSRAHRTATSGRLPPRDALGALRKDDLSRGALIGQ